MPDNRIYTPAELRQMTDEQLDAELAKDTNEYNFQGLAAISTEMNRRHLERSSVPHWTQTGAFWAGVIAAAFGGIAAYPIVAEWIKSISR